MTRRRLVLASGNAGKIREIQALLKDLAVDLLSGSDRYVPEVQETGRTFVENAILKARHVAAQTKLPAIADDSGLVVDALGGAPGVCSARFAGVGVSDADNIAKLIDQIKPLPEDQRGARFICVIVSLQHAADPLPIIATGQWDGVISDTPRGTHGFGYDPIFYLPVHQCTAAELPAAVKNAESHRGRALAKWKECYTMQYVAPHR